MQPGTVKRCEPLEALTDPELLLQGMVSFVSWELAGALAYLRLGALADDRLDEGFQFEGAIRQLEATAECLASLSIQTGKRICVARSVERLCRAVAAGRLRPGQEMLLSLPRTVVRGALARIVSIVAAGLVTNTFRCALERGGTRLGVRLIKAQGELSLAVMDDGPGLGIDSPFGSGRDPNLMSELVRRHGGRVNFRTDPQGSVTIVTFPLRARRRKDC